MMQRRRWQALLIPLALVACATPYRPARLELPAPLPEDAAARILGVLRQQGFRVGRAEHNPLRVQSKWSDHQRADVPGWKRATVFIDEPSTLNVVVEVRYLNIDLFGNPYETPATGDMQMERELQLALRDAFQ